MIHGFRWWLFKQVSWIGWAICPEPHRTNLSGQMRQRSWEEWESRHLDKVADTQSMPDLYTQMEQHATMIAPLGRESGTARWRAAYLLSIGATRLRNAEDDVNRIHKEKVNWFENCILARSERDKLEQRVNLLTEQTRQLRLALDAVKLAAIGIVPNADNATSKAGNNAVSKTDNAVHRREAPL